MLRHKIPPLLSLILLAYLSSPVLAAEQIASAQPAANQKISLKKKPRHKLDYGQFALRSKAALIEDSKGTVLFDRTADKSMPIASITKLMTAMVVLDAKLPLSEKITISKADRDLIRLTGSRLKYGASLSRKTLITLALMSSENRAASALARSFPGGQKAFVVAMNHKAKALSMNNSQFVDSVGLSADNRASARDLMRMLKAARTYPLIRKATTLKRLEVFPYRKKGPLTYVNTNRLLKNKAWQVYVGKTGYINESGRCFVMQAKVENRNLNIVLLDSFGKLTPFGDSNRIRKWIRQTL